jgi:short-subunit dehydrogenase
MKLTFDANCKGSMQMCYYATPHLLKTKTKERGIGRILFISSLTAYYPVPKCSLYNSSKVAMHRFLDTLRMELDMSLGPNSLWITIGAPGLVNTDTAATYISSKDMENSMSAEECARIMIDAAIEGRREVLTNVVQRPIPISGNLVYFLTALFPEFTDRILRSAYHFHTEQTGGIKDAVERPFPRNQIRKNTH